jgi:DNA-binding MarR family transcriptional regulator
LNISKQALNFILDRLQRDGLVTRVDDPDDRRSKQIQLTVAGRQAAEVNRGDFGADTTTLAVEYRR